ncbi:Hint domain-containing protein [Tritonibacter horizontis]|uniref:Hedgehog/Intein (Hint) domain-containing protein n=1 Tax=Tritonibacter horizontis TaxID=1768241 RepID=A0A132BZX8_9RHOB|nr:Hint domain-containing protein [Tritonibacter horizontis]KUP93894.1 hypothetical protein TRIHO_12150 [Tritonibacter horizontis]
MSVPQSLQRAAMNIADTKPLLRDHSGARGSAKPQLRRYEVCSLLSGGQVAETRHIAPALPLFEQAFTAFTRGSLVETDHGPIAIEDLYPGDRILTRKGTYEPLIWKGMTTLIPSRKAATGTVQALTSFMADALGMERPASCVVTGPAARLLRTPAHMRHAEGDSPLLTPVQEFLDGMNIVETAPPAPIDMYHLCLAQHAVIRVGGLELETYHPGPDALRLVSYPIKTLFLNMFPHVEQISDFGPLAFDRARVMQA